MCEAKPFSWCPDVWKEYRELSMKWGWKKEGEQWRFVRRTLQEDMRLTELHDRHLRHLYMNNYLKIREDRKRGVHRKLVV